MSTKFLGLDTINVLTEYIKQYINQKQEDLQLITLQVYKYFKHGETVTGPQGEVSYSFVTNEMTASVSSWNSLANVLKYITSTDGLKYESINAALVEGDVYMSSAIIQGGQDIAEIDWSTPMKVSGQNGENGIEFAFSYDPVTPHAKRSMVPLPIDEDEHSIVYYWMKPVGGEWPADDTHGTIWAIFAKNGVSGMKTVFQYHITKDLNAPDHDSPYWTNGIAYGENGFSKDVPFLWMRYKTIPADKSISWTDPNDPDSYWSEVYLFAHYGQDGNVPDYNITLYHKGNDSDDPNATKGIIKPADIEITDKILVDDFLATTSWKMVPDFEGADRDVIWWQCTIHVNGKDMSIDSQESVGQIVRYNQVVPEATPGQFTKYLYRWSENQILDEADYPKTPGTPSWKPNGWNEDPATGASDNPNASIWMISAVAYGMNDRNQPDIPMITDTDNPWSNPIRISGTRGPASMDYRIETRYMEGTEIEPKVSPEEGIWYKLDGKMSITSKDYPYIWAADYLVVYKMEYVMNNDGSFKLDENGDYVVEPEENGTLLKNYGYYRLSGKDGEDGNRKNSLKYDKAAATVDVTSFATTNLYISNSADTVSYTINLDALAYVNGYTGKFVNIGTGNMLVTTEKFTFVNADKTAKSITILPQESIELICYTDNELGQVLLVLGKTLE